MSDINKAPVKIIGALFNNNNMENYTKSIKGQKGFSKFYNTLGICKSMKVPESVYDKIKTILTLLEFIGNHKGLDAVNGILKNFIIGLEKYIKEKIN